MENLSPMLQQYFKLKEQVQDAILLFRLGDFYECFFEDAKLVASELELVLTFRAAGNNQKAPMCGVPHHASQNYIQRLVDKGYKVAIAEQGEVVEKGLVERNIVNIVSPGTNLLSSSEQPTKLLVVVSDLFSYYGVIYDIVNNAYQNFSHDKEFQNLYGLIIEHNVVEVVTNDDFLIKQLTKIEGLCVSECRKNHVDPLIILNEYLSNNLKMNVNIRQQQQQSAFLKMDYLTIAQLELFKNQRLTTKKNSLYDYLDKTKTKIGSRLLKEIISKPLLDIDEINYRLDLVTKLIADYALTSRIIEVLKQICDIEKITTKISLNKVLPNELLQLKTTLLLVEDLKTWCRVFDLSQLPSLMDIIDVLERYLNDENVSGFKEGGYIRDGVSLELDECRLLLNNSHQWLLGYEQSLKEASGIKNLKIGYSRTFGHYIEVSKGQVALVTEDLLWQKKQLLANAQRYSTAQLLEHDLKVEKANTDLGKIEYQCFSELISVLKEYTEILYRTANIIAYMDVIVCFSQISSQSGYSMPMFNNTKIEIKQSFHPVLKQSLVSHQLIYNDYYLDQEQPLSLLTGPNMGGKSTYMRQLALIVIMAQIGCYVPCEFANIKIIDKIFTRMGAGDDIMSNQSTFMVEMLETNNALVNATNNSLLLFDEIGRGTSSEDGVALAQAIIEHIYYQIKCLTIFSTHYHQLTQLENIKNIQVLVDDSTPEITFLYKVANGAAQQSYGLHVAGLANLDKTIIQRAQYLLKHPLESIVLYEEKTLDKDYTSIINLLKRIDVNQITPLSALQVLADLVKEANDE